MSIEAPRRIFPGVNDSSVLDNAIPSGSIDGFFYTEKAGVVAVDYAQFVDTLKARIADEAVQRFRRRQVEHEGVALAEVHSKWPDAAEVNGAIYENFDQTAIHSLKALYGTLKQHELSQHVVFVAHERPFTPWEGPVQAWLTAYREPLERTGGMYGMYTPDEYPQLHFQRPDGSQL